MVKTLLCLIFALSALLVIFPAFTSWWWMAKVIVTEHAHLIFLCAFPLLAYLTFVKFNPYFFVCITLSAVVLILPLLNVVSKFKEIGYSPKLRELFISSGHPDIAIEELNFSNKGESLPISYFRAKSTTTSPLIVVLYGGSWTNGSRKDLPEINYFLAEVGFNVAAITYRHAPQTKFPGGVDDTIAAIQYLLTKSSELNIATDKVFLMGRSAGGQIASIAAIVSHKYNLSIKGVALIYAPTDLIWAYENTKPWHIISGQESISTYLGTKLNPTSRNIYEAASPAYAVENNSPPHLLIHSKKDDLVSIHHARAMIAKMNSLNVKSELLELSWANHGFDYFSRSPHSILLREKLKQFFADLSRAS